MPFLPPNQQRQSTEGKTSVNALLLEPIHNTKQKDKIHQLGNTLNLHKFTVCICGRLLWNALLCYKTEMISRP